MTLQSECTGYCFYHGDFVGARCPRCENAPAPTPERDAVAFALRIIKWAKETPADGTSAIHLNALLTDQFANRDARIRAEGFAAGRDAAARFNHEYLLHDGEFEPCERGSCKKILALPPPSAAQGEPDDDLISCARCNEMKECLLIDTGFAGEQEPMCADCISKERELAEAPASREREIAETRLEEAVGNPTVEEWADWIVSRHNFCEREAGESLREIALVALRKVERTQAAEEPKR